MKIIKSFSSLRNKASRANIFLFKTHRRKTLTSLALLAVWYWFCLPSPLFKDPTSMILEDADGNLLGARIAADGQWRFPFSDSIPDKFAQSIVAFEDAHFYSHPGVNPAALGRAFLQNIKNRKLVSGGSTITMQTIRLSRKGKKRTVYQKIVETIQATRLELTHSKKNILALYASNAPFGGNVVGLEAAAWRYFGKAPKLLSWSETATLAVLPNSPALIHLGRNRAGLLKKRNRLLDKLRATGKIDRLTCELAKEEPLPEQPLALPQTAPHLLDRAFFENVYKQEKLSRVRTTIDGNLQNQVNHLLSIHHNTLLANGIHNAAALVLDVETGNVVAYCGNATGVGKEYGEEVDVIKAPRSTGSILKPFLFAFAQQEGDILPNSLLEDVPTDLGNYHPENFNETYDGVIPARRALSRSLNIPFVRLLNQYGLEKFHYNLKKLGFTTFNKPASHYGLTMILGGGEGTLWEILNAYTCMARTAKHFYTYNSRYDPRDWRYPNYLFEKKFIRPKENELVRQAPVLNAAASWLALDAMKEVERPDAEGSWELFQNNKTVAWKTGTSFGFRDAWACGVTPRYAVGVWAGNASGEGRPGLVGVEAAAPLMFDIFNLLNTPDWFDQPYDDMEKIEVCRQSGFRAAAGCEKDTVWAAKGGEKAVSCNYHPLIHLDKTRQWQVSGDCEQPQNMVHQNWFVLPPLEEYYYKPRNPSYLPPPPYRKDCRLFAAKTNPMQLIYPKSPTKIYLPVDLDGKIGSVVFRIAHQHPETPVFWHLDNEYVTTTRTFHEIALTPPPGRRRLTVVDADGNRLQQDFEIIIRKQL